jgi:maltose-binding protein MalE
MAKKYNYNFSSEKNQKLIKERNISFDEIISAIENGFLLDVVEHPNKQRYNDQKMYIVKSNDYIYLVPFVTEKDNTIFLKTIFPSRKTTKKYLKESKNYE